MSAHAPTNEHSLESGLLDEKRALQNPINPPTPVVQQKRRMSAIRRFLVALTVSVLVSVAVALNYPAAHGLHRNVNVEAVVDNTEAVGDSTFAELLKSASPEALHKLLHDYLPEKFQHGVFASDKDAVDAVHDDSAALVNSLVQVDKRQNNNNNNSSTSEPPPETTTPEETTTSKEPETTSEPPTEPTTEPTSNPPETSKTPDPTTPGPTPTSTSDNDPDSTSTSSKKTTSRSAATTNTKTSTLPGGGITIITSTSYYDLPPEATDDSSDPELQNAAHRPNAVAIIPALFGVVAALAL